VLAELAEELERDGIARPLLEAMPGACFVVDERRQIVTSNRQGRVLAGTPAPEALLGRRPGEALGCRVVPTAPSGCGSARACRSCGLTRTILHTLESGRPTVGECQIATTGSDVLEMEVTATRSRLQDRSLVFLGLRSLSAERRRETFERLFLHDVINAAGCLHGLAQLRVAGVAEVPAEDFAARVLEQSGALLEEIESYTQLCAAEDGSARPEFCEIVLPELLESIRAAYAGHPVARGRRLRASCPPLTLHSDPTLLRRLIGNLIKNALEATPEGGEVSLWAQPRPGHVRIGVRNPGTLPRRARSRLFQRRFSTKGTGRGLGLHSARLLSERYLGGRVRFESARDAGTVFFVSLPLSDPGARPAPAPAAAPAQPQWRPYPWRVLVADDNRVNRLVARYLLEQRGCRVTEAVDGEQAIAACPPGSHDLVLLDVEMPRMGGLEAVQRLRKVARLPGSLRIVAFTANTRPDERLACHRAGFDDVLSKPLQVPELDRVLAQLARAAQGSS
jgi:hypothetical protein